MAPVVVPPTPATYDGVWNGQSEQVQPVSFTVSSNKITSINFNYAFTNSASTCTGSGGFGGAGSLATIADDAFLIVDPFKTAKNLTWVVSARFTSPTSATGTLEVNLAPVDPAGRPTCAGFVKTVWTAGKS
jgi:hypothetical protein